jgi:hypothetical protein
LVAAEGLDLLLGVRRRWSCKDGAPAPAEPVALGSTLLRSPVPPLALLPRHWGHGGAQGSLRRSSRLMAVPVAGAAVGAGPLP